MLKGFISFSHTLYRRHHRECQPVIHCMHVIWQVSALKCGLQPVCAEAMAVDEVSYYDYVGAIVDAERRDKLRRALGPANKASPRVS